ncbi:MAG: sterol desaturase family protein [Pseudomonadota bacterium]
MSIDTAIEPSAGRRRPTPLSIIKMSGLREIIAVSSGMAAVFIIAALLMTGDPLFVLALVLVGLFVWTFLEYILHRWMLHWEPEEKFYKLIRKCFPSHRSHHDSPMNERKNIKLQLKIVVYLFVAYTAFLWLIGIPLAWALPVNAGILFGYQAYEYVHVACHHLPMRNAWAALLKRHHGIHHHRDETVNFGVTTTIWDSVFRTTWKPAIAKAG